MDNNVTQVKIADIKIGKRFRKDMGNLQELADSVETCLLQPIGITADYQLVFGERRLRACRDVLGRKTISARIVPIESLLLGEIAENTLRKDYTPSELVAIVQAMREFTHGGDRRSDQVRKGDHESLTTEEAARKVGWSKDQFSRAQKVVEQGTPELQAAMDRKDIAISAAAVLADASPDDQRASLARPINGDKWQGRGVIRRLHRIQHAKERNALLSRQLSLPPDDGAVRTYHCPFQQLEATAELQPASVHLICTDIPYGNQFLDQIEQLAAFAHRVLVPGGAFVSYVGQYKLNEKLRALDRHLTFHWLPVDQCWRSQRRSPADEPLRAFSAKHQPRRRRSPD